MPVLRGDLAAMPLPDLLQWVDLAKKSGTVRLLRLDVEKKVYLEEGSVIFVSTNREGERLGEYLRKGSFLEAEKIRSALQQSQAMKTPFTQRLIDLGYFGEDRLREIIALHAEEILLDCMAWDDGSFEFIQDDIPSHVIRGTISLSAIGLIHRLFQEIERRRIGLGQR